MKSRVTPATGQANRSTDGTTIAADACIACGASRYVPLAPATGAYRVLVCAGCGLGRTVPQPPDDALRGLYEGDYAGAGARKLGGPLEATRRMFARALAGRIARRLGAGGRVLDVGCGDGKVLVALAARGYSCAGTELNPRVQETLPTGAEIAVHGGTLEDARFPSASFRIVLLRHVLEHVRDPAATLREVRRVIEPWGTLILAVPNLASWQARIARDRWFHLDLPRHLYHFTPGALTTLLEHCGFRVERISHFSHEQNPYGWLQSGFNMAGGRWRALYDQLRATGAAQARRPDPLALTVALVLSPFCIALAAIESAAGAGGAIEAWARPV